MVWYKCGNKPEVFVAHYGETTLDEVKAARADGRMIFCSIQNMGFLPLRISSDDKFYFIGKMPLDMQSGSMWEITLDKSGWNINKYLIIPYVDKNNNGQILQVVNGAWEATTITNAEGVAY